MALSKEKNFKNYASMDVQSRRLWGAKRIWNRNLQTEITVPFVPLHFYFTSIKA